MGKFKSFFGKIGRIKGFKYIVVTLLAVLIVGFVDENSVWNHFKNQRKISELNSEIAHYKMRYDSDMSKLREMDTDHKVVEKIARERYYMKKDDEDIFVINDKSEE